MKINKLHVTNFLNISEADFEFNESMNFIYGQPASGKSAIFEAMMITLSTNKRSSTYGEYVKQGEDLATIHLEAELLGKLAIFDTTINRVKGNACQRILHYDDNTYENDFVEDWLKKNNIDYYAKLIFLMQNEQNIVDIGSAERLVYIQKLFNFNFKTQKDKLIADKREIESKIVELNSKIAGNKSTIDILSVEKPTEKRLLTDDQKKEYEETISKNMLMIEENQKIQKKIDELKSEINSIDISLAKYSTEIKVAESNEAAELKRNIEIESTSREVEDLNKSIKIAESDRDQKQLCLDKFKSAKKDSQEYKDSLNIKMIEVKQSLSNIQSKINLVKQGCCPTCGQPTHGLDDNLDEKYEELKESQSELQISLDNTIAHLYDLESKVSESTTNVNSAISNVNKLINLKTNKESKIQSLKEMAFSSDISLSEIKAKKNELESKRKIKENEIRNLSSDKTTDDILKEIEPLRKAINDDAIIFEKNELIIKTNLENKAKCASLSLENEKLLEEVIALNNKVTTIKEAYEIINKTLPQFISKSICDNLQLRINKFIHRIFPKFDVVLKTTDRGCDLEYTKDKSISDEKRNKFLKAKMSSGLERSLLNLAFKVSLAEAYNLDIFVGDEIDQSSNDHDAKILMDILINSNNFDQLFIISHKKAVLNHITENYKGNLYHVDNGNFTKTSF